MCIYYSPLQASRETQCRERKRDCSCSRSQSALTTRQWPRVRLRGGLYGRWEQLRNTRESKTEKTTLLSCISSHRHYIIPTGASSIAGLVYIAVYTYRGPAEESFHSKMNAHISQFHTVEVMSKRLVNGCNCMMQLKVLGSSTSFTLVFTVFTYKAKTITEKMLVKTLPIHNQDVTHLELLEEATAEKLNRNTCQG